MSQTLVVAIICGSALAYTGYKFGRSVGFDAGRDDVFAEVEAGESHPVCYRRQAQLVARYSPFFPTSISAGILDQLVVNPAPPPGSTVRESMGPLPKDPVWLKNMQARSGAEFTHPFLSGATHG